MMGVCPQPGGAPGQHHVRLAGLVEEDARDSRRPAMGWPPRSASCWACIRRRSFGAPRWRLATAAEGFPDEVHRNSVGRPYSRPGPFGAATEPPAGGPRYLLRPASQVPAASRCARVSRRVRIPAVFRLDMTRPGGVSPRSHSIQASRSFAGSGGASSMPSNLRQLAPLTAPTEAIRARGFCTARPEPLTGPAAETAADRAEGRPSQAGPRIVFAWFYRFGA